ncbi:hypothetical protein DKX38_020220 [Salix brachista]|uniref:O-methyltransferase C-terminal domain-containing protein n=1 Tax=Salix brachista TaxID=2182728 RepID=A0A5N5KIF7_9ROSI|nr:hypothetical protein DKX38_020220 [Salix brachista]
MASQEAEAMFKSQVEISQLVLGFVDSMALKCAVELRLADIINSHGRPISLSQIASEIYGFNNIRSLVDVAGGMGGNVAEIVRAYPLIKGSNLDLPHVVATAPQYEGVSHVAGNMFEAIPNADTIFIKRILHDWTDESCVEILRNCRKAIPEKTGKLIIVDIVLQTDYHRDPLDDMRLTMDLVMLVVTSGGKERTEHEWKKLLEEGGFPRYKIIKIPALESIIEAYPQ